MISTALVNLASDIVGGMASGCQGECDADVYCGSLYENEM